MENNLKYEQSLISFQKKREGLLELLAKVTPQASELHRRRWRVQKLDNSLFDIKQTVAACNMQLDDERTQLEDLNSETDRLKAMNYKLMEDVKILEGVTGIRSMVSDRIKDPIYDKINEISLNFRDDFSDFYQSLPIIKQELPLDPTIEKTSRVLIDTLHDCVGLTFDTRAENAFLSKEANDKTIKMKEFEKELKAKEMKLQTDVDNQRKRIEESTKRMLMSIDQQGTELRKEAHRIEEEFMKEHIELKKNIDSLASQERNLIFRVNNMKTYNESLKENMKRRVLELEVELDRFHKRINVIRRNPKTVDKKLVNMSLLMSRKSALLDQAIQQMRTEIASFDLWLAKRKT
ncbi:hypothetical protein TRFO_38231 [Tritrichomonas foetus]|uniref:Uncharacterized protein n=1 Tax=Tritrichomonas foetus TaxID=1144522 RepID=A0A1J4JEF1_9EUKA|nr:hypothetical protein TRFO_38231 [Tritrichomonas foetus]|eukprot:OHS95636.1 hypothetical protein TRFO_38231 [Tritrichomonas foetus]